MSGALAPLASAIRAREARVAHADTIAEAIAVLRTDRAITLALCETGFDIAGLRASLDAEGFQISLLACTTAARPGIGADALRRGASDVLELPLPDSVLDDLLAEPNSHAAGPIAEDPVTIDMLQRAAKVAASDATVLILGESGTGKEVFARFIHRHSRRAEGPFIAINCAAIPDNLLESELFGYEKGAFSGAMARRIGRFEAAQRGTLLLDEIGEIDIRLQAKLLRAIQEREIDRVGGTSPVPIDVRILATTNRDLRADVRRGVFREDLYYRINVITLELPPLRQRVRDILPLANFFAAKYAALNGITPRGFNEPSRRVLLARGWPGNVRELENAIHRSVLTSTGACLQIECDSEQARLQPAGEPADLAGRRFVGSRLDEVERHLILETLEHTHGNRTHAASMLGISIRALRNRIREYATMGMAVPTPQNTASVS